LKKFILKIYKIWFYWFSTRIKVSLHAFWFYKLQGMYVYLVMKFAFYARIFANLYCDFTCDLWVYIDRYNVIKILCGMHTAAREGAVTCR